MGVKFNPFTSKLDVVDSPDGDFSSLDISGDITLDDGGTYTTTVQVVTPTANRTISFPDATGTVALVAGSSGQLTYNDAGAQAGLTSANIGSTGAIDISLAGADSTPPVKFTGSWFTGGTGITTKPQLLIEPTGTTSTAWSTSGTGLGVNAASGFSGRLLDLQTNGTSRMVVQGDGKLLVGTANVSVNSTVALQGSSSSTAADAELYICRGSTPTTTAGGEELGYIHFADNAQGQAALIAGKRDGGTWTAGSSHPGKLVFSTTADGASSPTERMRITSSGSSRHYVDTTGLWVATGAAAGTSIKPFIISHSATGIASGTESLRIFSNGNVENTNASYLGISDIKLKENIVDASSQWDDLKALQVRNYNFKEETGHQTHTQIGLIAQEAELVSPGLVSESPDLDAEGNDLGTTTKSVNYSVLYMKAVKALQEAMERIEVLEAKVAALEA